jgi:FtsP/CotA-like multicopper oxidase with cupredoxin domain
MIEFTYPEPGHFMFHAHQSEFVELGWMSAFQVS